MKKIFIVGTGRSGTHLLARSLGSCPEVDANIENSKYFRLLTHTAIYKGEKKEEDINELLKEYNKFLNRSGSRLVLDKTHPNLWLVEHLDNIISNPFYIGIKRNVYATVSSMLNHDGVLKWYNQIDLSKPNSFLGITSDNLKEFSNLPIESKCALRWKSHKNELLKLNDNYSNFLLIDYEEFYKELDCLKSKINNFLNEDLVFNIEKLNTDGDIKWQKNLSDRQIENINFAISSL